MNAALSLLLKSKKTLSFTSRMRKMFVSLFIMTLVTSATWGQLPSLSITDVTMNEGNSGTTTFTFTVHLSEPAVIPVIFDIATADGTATAGSDYMARALTGQTIATGDTSFTFDVTVNGDLTIEADETFFVNVTNVVGATVADGQGQGTILE